VPFFYVFENGFGSDFVEFNFDKGFEKGFRKLLKERFSIFSNIQDFDKVKSAFE